MAHAPAPALVSTELESHPARAALVERVRTAALGAAARRDASALGAPGSVPELTSEQATTRFGDVLEILARGTASPTEATLLSVLIALGVADDFPSAPETELDRAKDLCFLAAHSPFNAPLVVDAVLGPQRVAAFWRAVAQLAEPTLAEPSDRSISLAALAALASSTSDAGHAAAAELGARTLDPLARALLTRPTSKVATRLSGELSPAPHGPVATLFLAFTGILLFTRGVRAVGRLALALKQPAELRVSERGLECSHRTELLGRVIGTKETLIPIANLARVTREVRYPRLGLYLGLVALAVGSYLGMSLLVDGARVPGGSLPLLGMGLVVLALGLVVDYGITVLSDNVRGRCRIVVIPKKGKRICVGALDPASADAMVSALAAQTK